LNRIKIISFILAGLLVTFLLIATFSGKNLLSLVLLDFVSLLRRVYLGVAVLILLILVWASTSNKQNTPMGKSWIWGISFGAVLLVSFATSYYANPHGRFPVQRYLSTFPLARSVKSALYNELDYNPQLIIFGTSRAFTLSPAYLHQQTGYTAFNFSVEGARGIDLIWQLNYILDQKIEPPHVLIVETAVPIPSGLETEELTREILAKQPFAMVPYMTRDQQTKLLMGYGEDIFSDQSFLDSLYLMTHPLLTPDKQTWQFQADGFGIRKPVPAKMYHLAVQSEMKSFNNSAYYCADLDDERKEFLKQLVKKAAEQHIGIVFYISPLNETALQKVFRKNPLFFQCQKAWEDFMSQVKSEYSNVWSLNLAEYQPVSSMKEAGYYDSLHLREKASRVVIDKLLPSILSAFQWAEAQAK
jgi:hypothetical protein